MNDLPKTKKALGQHWLTDRTALLAIAEAAQITPDDEVLEIGPGTGTLTQILCERAGHVTAVEFDMVLATELSNQVGNPSNLTVTESDILKYDLTQLPEGYAVVANIPYYLTSNLIRVLSESINPPRVAVLLIQKEVAERVAAAPGDMSVLSVTAQLYWNVSLDREVPAALFTPPPKVESQILVLHRREEPLFADTDYKAFIRLVKIGYSQRRKTILNTLSAGLHLPKSVVETACEEADILPTVRAQALSLENWHSLYRAIEPLQTAR